MKITIGPQAREILKGINQIYQSIIIRSDYLYTKFVDSEVGNTKKGAGNIIVEYKLQPGDIDVPQEFGINNIMDFLGVINTFDSDTLEMHAEGNTIRMTDKRKKFTYYTQTTSALPVKATAGDVLYEQGTPIISFHLTEAERDSIRKDLSILKGVDSLTLVNSESGLKIVAENTVTSNNTDIVIDPQYVTVSDDSFQFPNVDIFDLIVDDNYKVTVKNCTHKNKNIKICKLESMKLTGLVYTLVSVED